MSKSFMSRADKIRLLWLWGPDNVSTVEQIAKRVGTFPSVVKELVSHEVVTFAEIDRLTRKWCKRMKKDLLKGEIVGMDRFSEFTKSGEWVDVHLNGGFGECLRVDAKEWVMENICDYYGL